MGDVRGPEEVTSVAFTGDPSSVPSDFYVAGVRRDGTLARFRVVASDDNRQLVRLDGKIQAATARPASPEELIMFEGMSGLVSKYLTAQRNFEEVLEQNDRRIHEALGLLERARNLLTASSEGDDENLVWEEAFNAWSEDFKRFIGAENMKGQG